MFTILGATGFVGSSLVGYLRSAAIPHTVVGRGEAYGSDLGNVVFCIGLTADFRERPLDTIQAHVGELVHVLGACRFESLLYLSSTRVYQGAVTTTEESDLRVNPTHPSDLYNLTKLAGEAACLSSGSSTVRVVRLSNVYGADRESQNFLSSVIRAAIRDRRVTLQSARTSTKDYVSIEDVTKGLVDIALYGKERIYNLASGVQVSHGEILDGVSRVTGCQVEYARDAQETRFPAINIGRLQKEFDYRPRRLVDQLETLIETYRGSLAP